MGQLTKTTNSKSGRTRSGRLSLQVGALGGAVARPVGAGAGEASAVGKSNDSKE
jgi:hypothetical protein